MIWFNVSETESEITHWCVIDFSSSIAVADFQIYQYDDESEFMPFMPIGDLFGAYK